MSSLTATRSYVGDHHASATDCEWNGSVVSPMPRASSTAPVRLAPGACSTAVVYMRDSVSEGSHDATQRIFCRCADRWSRETSHLSTFSRRRRHPAFRQMLALGNEAIPLALKKMDSGDVFFFLVLDQIVPNPPTTNVAGDMDAIRSVWLDWGRQRGYCS